MNQRNKWFFYMKLYPLLILIVILFMCVGYATINGIDLSVSGDALALLKDGIYVTEALYSDSDVANVSESYIKSSTGSILNSHIVLSDTDPDSSITYKVTIYNGLEYNYQFVSAEFDSNFYDNTDITFSLSDELNTNTILEPTDSVVFYITFKYASGVTPSSENNILNGYVNINSLVEYLVKQGKTIEGLQINNDISEKYIAYLEAMPKDYYIAISKDYGIDLNNNIYTTMNFAGSGEKMASISTITQVYTSLLEETEFKDYSGMIGSLSSSFSQSLDNSDYLLSQYDIFFLIYLIYF